MSDFSADGSEPRIVAEATAFLVVFKPRSWHCAPLPGSPCLFDWCAERYPEIRLPDGPKSGEGGLVHRLDRDTAGLTLIARGQSGLDSLLAQQAAGRFRKEYRAVAERRPCPSGDGWPLPPAWAAAFGADPGSIPEAVASAFRPFGPGRRRVRPAVPPYPDKDIALDAGKPYRTEFLEVRAEAADLLEMRVRLVRGFRHQVRCHLAWIGWPVVGDPLYGRPAAAGSAFRFWADALEFADPATGEARRFALTE